MQIKKITGVIKAYAWGSLDYLPKLFNYKESGEPQAEAWFSTHSAGESTLEDKTKLSEYILSNPEELLGSSSFKKYGPKLPILLKVLAINEPLSIQCHPTLEQARAGYYKERELRAFGVDYNELNYKDDNEKAEILYALSPVSAMCGFREYDEIVNSFNILFPNSFNRYLKDKGSIRALFEAIFKLDKSELKELIDEYIYSLKQNDNALMQGSFLTEKGIALRCFDIYKYDCGILMPYMLNLVHLEVGEALYLEPDILHAYVYGNGIELMTLSDNVLRSGLTKKKVDLEELLSIMNEKPTRPAICEKNTDSFKRTVFKTTNTTFKLCELNSTYYEIKEKSPSLLFSLDNDLRVGTLSSYLDLKQGECCFIPALEDGYYISVKGKAFQAVVNEE